MVPLRSATVNLVFELPQTADWIMHPGKAHLGIAERDLEFEEKVQLQPPLSIWQFTM